MMRTLSELNREGKPGRSLPDFNQSPRHAMAVRRVRIAMSVSHACMDVELFELR